MTDNHDYYIKGNFITRSKHQQTLFKNDITRYIAYILQSILVFVFLFFSRITKKKSKEYKYTLSLCGIFKNEAKFLEEWINYHLVIGVDHFYLYNNNSDDNFIEILQPFIDKGIVDLIDWPYQQAQMAAYEDCYKKNKIDTNWLTFIDLDEFICPIATDNIQSWLQSYKNYPGVAVYWKQFGSNGKLSHDVSKLVIEQYTQCWPKPDTFTKMFCNMDFEISNFDNPHLIKSKVFGFEVPPINQYKRLISFGVNIIPYCTNELLQINHYWGKAFDVFVENKINKTYVTVGNDDEISQLRMRLLKTHEAMCTERNFTIQRFLLYTKLKNSTI